MTRRWILTVPVVVSVPVIVMALAVGGCDQDVPGAGADPARVGPSIGPAAGPPVAADLGTTTAPATTPTAASPSAETDPVRLLRGELSAALRAKDPKAEADGLTVERLPAANDQLVINWTVSRDTADATAKARLRTDAIELLRVVKKFSGSYGSAVLIAHAAVLNQSGNKTDSQVLRAKYSRALIGRTDFATLSADAIFKIPDDKPADIHPSYQ